MMAVLCVARRCRTRGFHHSDCAGSSECLGCEPRLAADGLDLCWPHRDSIAKNARAAAEIFDELALQLAPGGSAVGEQVTAKSVDKGLKLNTAAVDAREEVIDVLTSWSLLVADERGFSRPIPHVDQMATFIADSATWLAAHSAAADCVDELQELAWGRPRSIAYPSGTRSIKLGSCPRCEGELVAVMRRPDSLLPSEVVCTGEDVHRWRGAGDFARLGELVEGVACRIEP